jgi:hypothetical protein
MRSSSGPTLKTKTLNRSRSHNWRSQREEVYLQRIVTQSLYDLNGKFISGIIFVVWHVVEVRQTI